MERLTRRLNNNKIVAIKGDGCNYSVHSFDCQISEGRKRLGVALEKLAEYEDLEEQGLLVRLPDDLNRVLYQINYRWTECTEYGEENNKCEIYDCKYECDSRKEYYIAEVDLQYIPIKSYYNCLGEFLFLTREEAENKLEERKNEI